MSRFVKTSGTVLKSLSFGEGHKMVTLFTSASGKIDASAFGVRKTKSRFGSSLETFTIGNFLLYRARPENPFTVREVDVLSANTALRENLKKYLLGSAVVEPVVRFVERFQPDEELHRLLTSALLLLDRMEEDRGIVLLCMYELQFLAVMGYRPEMDACVKCGRSIPQEEPRYADPRFGFPVCGSCREPSSRQASEGAVQFIRWTFQNSLSLSERVAMKANTLRSVRQVIESLYTTTFNRRPESWNQLALLED